MSRKIFDYESFPGAAGTDITAIAPTSSDSAAPYFTVTGGSFKADGSGNLVVTGNSNAKGLMPSPTSGQFDAEIGVSSADFANYTNFGFYIEQGTATYYACVESGVQIAIRKIGGNTTSDMPNYTAAIAAGLTAPYTFVVQKRISGGKATLTPVLNGTTYPAATDVNPQLGSVPSAAAMLVTGTTATVTRFDVVDPAGVTPPPLVPGSVASSAVTSTGATLTLSGTTGGTSPYAAQFQQAPDAGGSPGTWTNVGTGGGSAFSTQVLTPATTYWFRAILTDSSSPAQAATTAAVSVTTGPLVLPGAPTAAISSANAMDAITYQAGTAGSYPVASYLLYSGTTAGGESATSLASNAATAPMSFSNNQGDFWYTIRAVDTAGNLSPASNEVQGGASTGPVTLAQEQVLLNNLATVLLGQISALLTSFFAARDAADVTGIQGAFADFLAARASVVSMVANQEQVALNAAPTGTPAPGSAAAQLAATATGVAALPSADAIVADMTTKAGPVKDAVAYLAGYYDVTTVPGWTIVRDRTGAEVERFPTAGRTKLVLPGNVAIGPTT